MKFATTLM